MRDDVLAVLRDDLSTTETLPDAVRFFTEALSTLIAGCRSAARNVEEIEHAAVELRPSLDTAARWGTAFSLAEQRRGTADPNASDVFVWQSCLIWSHANATMERDARMPLGHEVDAIAPCINFSTRVGYYLSRVNAEPPAALSLLPTIEEAEAALHQFEEDGFAPYFAIAGSVARAQHQLDI